MEAHIPKPDDRADPAPQHSGICHGFHPRRVRCSFAVPESGAFAWRCRSLPVVAGSLLLALSAKAKVVLGPADLSLQSLVVLLIAAAFGFRLGVATLLFTLPKVPRAFPSSRARRKRYRPAMVGVSDRRLRRISRWPPSSAGPMDRGCSRSLLGFCRDARRGTVMFAMGMSWLAQFIGPEKVWQFGVQPSLSRT